jgi:hypothetical protein
LQPAELSVMLDAALGVEGDTALGVEEPPIIADPVGPTPPRPP